MEQVTSEKPTQSLDGELLLLDDIVSTANLPKEHEAFTVIKQGLELLIKGLVRPEYDGHKVDSFLIDMMVAEIDEKLSHQIDEILHHETFQKAESAWRGLKYLVDHVDFRENVRVELLNVSKEDLIDDFEDSPEIIKSGLYQTVYTKEYGQFGGQPYGALIGNYEFGIGSQDINLLRNMASVAAMSHAPFISAASKSFFGIDEWEELSRLKDLRSVFDSPQYTKWNEFRDSDDARHVGITLPGFLLREPYGNDNKPCKLFNYQEQVGSGDSNFLWGNTAFSFASRLADSFSQYRWCANIIGPQGGGSVDNLPVYHFQDGGETKVKTSTQVLLSERREFELSEMGLIGLSMRKGSANAAFFSANSCQRPKVFPNTAEGKQAELNYKLSTQLPYMMIMDRLAHYIKVIQRENIGSWREKQDIEKELNKWLSQYITEMDNPQPSVRSRRPLRAVELTVDDVEGEPGWYQVSLNARPHFKYMGSSFTLSLVGKLDKE